MEQTHQSTSFHLLLIFEYEIRLNTDSFYTFSWNYVHAYNTRTQARLQSQIFRRMPTICNILFHPTLSTHRWNLSKNGLRSP